MKAKIVYDGLKSLSLLEGQYIGGVSVLYPTNEETPWRAGSFSYPEQQDRRTMHQNLLSNLESYLEINMQIAQ
jgi:hypothetical protein